MAKAEAKVVRTPRAFISYPHLDVAYVSDADRAKGRKAKFSCSLLFDADAQRTAEWAAVKEEANRFAIEYFGEARLKELIANQQFKTPFIIGDKFAAKSPECAGKIMLRVATTVKPGVVDGQLRPLDDVAAVYPGAVVIGSINAFGYEPTKENPTSGYGVSFGLRNVQVVDMTTPSFGGRTRPEDDFVPLEQAVKSGGAEPGGMF